MQEVDPSILDLDVYSDFYKPRRTVVKNLVKYEVNLTQTRVYAIVSSADDGSGFYLVRYKLPLFERVDDVHKVNISAVQHIAISENDEFVLIGS